MSKFPLISTTAAFLLICNCLLTPAQSTPISQATQADMNECNAALQLVDKGKYAQAEKTLAKFSQKYPDSVELLCGHAVCLFYLGKKTEGLNELNHAESLHATDVESLQCLGNSFLVMGQPAIALKVLRQFEQLHPKAPEMKQVKATINTILTDEEHEAKAENSKGKDDYFSEVEAGGAICRWQPSDMPVPVYISSGEGVAGCDKRYSEALKRAFEDWANASQNLVSFAFVQDATKAKIKCGWTSDTRKLINAAEGGHTSYLGTNGGHMQSCEITLLVCTDPPISDAELKNFALHEVGHALGFLGHSSQTSDVMYPAPARTNGLSDRDKKTLLALYTAPEKLFSEQRIDRDTGTFVGDNSAANRAIRFNNEGLSALKAHDYAKALSDFESAQKIDTDPSHKLSFTKNRGIALCGLSLAKWQAKDLNGALADLKQAVDLFQQSKHPDMAANAYRRMAYYCHDLGNNAQAVEFEAEANKLAPKSE